MSQFQQKMYDSCTKDACPSWWVCSKRGCYQDALNNYSSFKGKREAWCQDWYVASDGTSQEVGSGYHGQGLRYKGGL